MVQSFWKTVWQFLRKLNIIFIGYLTIMLPGIFSMDLKTDVHTKTST